ncbi:signal recognition particle 9 kDa protein-domain-containing protein [Pseudoneurospora amorphoporcata]|uniref:Signal recognition particle 9 kDa protein-domain-containing protein n=1 Tax=Pseudoneurospora amorphoporcata TaxID=241081 RepID=A0AAN6P526_9PEZI|nr:signal recognition particle 9 kDa protein-domain-containing protein [Pseudoneurospora amorphoporcata]
MPYYEKSEDWLHQSALLLQARPQTTRVTTSYFLRPAIRPSKAEKLAAKEARRAKESASKSTTTSKSTTKSTPAPAAPTTESTDATSTATQKPPRGHLVLKTFDPHSGVCLKYKTSKAAEVGRLIQMLGQLGRRMAALPVDEAKEASQAADVVMGEAAEEAKGEVSGTATPAGGTSTPAAGGAAGGGGQGKKKKKGKR